MAVVTGALIALAAMISAVTAATVVPRSQEDAQEFESSEAALNRQFQSTEAQTARDFSAAEAEKQRQFEKELSDTSYQRAVEDLKAAGLNPASVGLGLNGASSPSGAVAQIGGIPTGSAGHSGISNNNYFGSLFSSAVEYAMSKDRNFMNKTIAEMYTSNSRQMNELTNQTKRYFNDMYQHRTNTWHKNWRDNFSEPNNGGFNIL